MNTLLFIYIIPLIIGIGFLILRRILMNREEEEDLKNGGRRFGKDYDFLNDEEFKKWQ